MPLPVAERDRGAQRDLALDLVRVEVGGGGAVVHLAEPVDGAGGEQDGFHQGCLADPAVAREAHVADLGDVRRHAYLPVPLLRRENPTAGEKGDVGRDATTAPRYRPEAGPNLLLAHDLTAVSST
jgi:hypothetical protein